jgi:predicted ester cyclase
MPREGAVEMMEMFYASFPDFTHRIDALVAEGDWVAARLTFFGTHQADFQGIAATGNEVAFGGVHFFRIVDGQVHESWMLDDNVSFMQQLGMQFVPIQEG